MTRKVRWTGVALAASVVMGLVAPADAAVPGRTIDVLVLYTKKVTESRGSQGKAEQAIRESLASMNAALERSRINGQVRLVHVAETTYTESGDDNSDLTWLSGNVDVASLRDQYGADLVSLVVRGEGGLAHMPTTPSARTADQAFSVVGNDWLEPLDGSAGVFAHELGHNLSADHDWKTEPEPNPVHPYNKGYITPSGKWLDIMAYNTACGSDCHRIPYYANPRVTYQGEKLGETGGAHPSDLARLFTVTIPVVAKYRPVRTPA